MVKRKWRKYRLSRFFLVAYLFGIGLGFGLFQAEALGAEPQGGLNTIVSPWRGELLDGKQGAFYLKIQLEGFKGSPLLASDIRIVLVNIIAQTNYVFSHKLSTLDGFPRELWKVPNGKYSVARIEFIDPDGVRRQSVNFGQKFVIPKACLANLGKWTLSPKSPGSKTEGNASQNSNLAVGFEMVPNSYTEEGPKAESAIGAVVDGASGLIQKVFGGKRAVLAATGGGGANTSGGDLRAVVKFTRNIVMFFKLDLFKQNFMAKDVAAVLSTVDPAVRQCYIDRLDEINGENNVLKGTVALKILLSKATGTMKKIKVGESTLNDPKLIRCMTLELGKLSFPLKENAIGELTYTFDLR